MKYLLAACACLLLFAGSAQAAPPTNLQNDCGYWTALWWSNGLPPYTVWKSTRAPGGSWSVATQIGSGTTQTGWDTSPPPTSTQVRYSVRSVGDFTDSNYVYCYQGSEMPVDGQTGWNLAWTDDFNGTSFNSSNWGSPYSNCGSHRWAYNHAYVSDGNAVFDAYQDNPTIAQNVCSPNDGNWTAGYYSSGVQATSARSYHYEKVEAKIRFEAGYGVADALMVWPKSGCWPPEIDFSEAGSNSDTRDSYSPHFHYPNPGCNNDGAIHPGSLQINQASAYHILGVEWTSGKLAFTADNGIWNTLTDSRINSFTANGGLTLQTESCYPECPNSDGHTTPAHVRLYVDWVAVYTPG